MDTYRHKFLLVYLFVLLLVGFSLFLFSPLLLFLLLSYSMDFRLTESLNGYSSNICTHYTFTFGYWAHLWTQELKIALYHPPSLHHSPFLLVGYGSALSFFIRWICWIFFACQIFFRLIIDYIVALNVAALFSSSDPLHHRHRFSLHHPLMNHFSNVMYVEDTNTPLVHSHKLCMTLLELVGVYLHISPSCHYITGWSAWPYRLSTYLILLT